jgi:hypothetical protein
MITMTDLITAVFSVLILILGCSVVLQAGLWLQWARKLVESPDSILWVSLLLLPMGLVIVFGHNIWAWEWRVVVTVFGWLITVKYTFYLLWPQAVKYFSGLLQRDLVPLLRTSGLLYMLAGALSSWQVLTGLPA